MSDHFAVGGAVLKPLSHLPPGTLAEVQGIIPSDPALSRKLSIMGVVPGALVKVASIAPLGDPIEIVVLGYSLALRRNEADIVQVTLVQ